jgi:hypothetical protein
VVVTALKPIHQQQADLVVLAVAVEEVGPEVPEHLERVILAVVLDLVVLMVVVVEAVLVVQDLLGQHLLAVLVVQELNGLLVLVLTTQVAVEVEFI